MESLKNLIERSEQIILALEFILICLENPKTINTSFIAEVTKSIKILIKEEQKKLEELDVKNICLLMSYYESLREIQNPSLGEYRLLKRIKNFLEDIPYIKLIIHNGQLHWQYCFVQLEKHH